MNKGDEGSHVEIRQEFKRSRPTKWQRSEWKKIGPKLGDDGDWMETGMAQNEGVGVD